MKLKRLIAFTVVMAVVMSCFCAVSTTVSADTVYKNLLYFNGELNNKSGVALLKNQDYSYTASDGVLTVSNHRLHATSGDMKSTHYIAFAGSASNSGILRISTENSDHGDYYEVTYGDLRQNFYSDSSATQPTPDYPVLLFSYYLRIPKDGIGVDKEQVLRLSDASDYKNIKANRDGMLYVNFTYSSETRKIAVSTEQTGMDLVWGNPSINILPDVWYKIECRVYIDQDNKLCFGVYFDNVQVAYYRQRAAEHFHEYLSVYQADFWGPATIGSDGKETHSTSQGLTHFDDIHYGLYPKSYIPSATEVSLSEDKASNKAIAKIYGNKIDSANLIVALYKGEKLQKLATTTLASATTIDGGKELTCDFPAGDYDNYKLFLFDSLSSLKPLTLMVPGTK